MHGYEDGLYGRQRNGALAALDEYDEGYGDGVGDRHAFYGVRQYQPGDKIDASIGWNSVILANYVVPGDIISCHFGEYFLDPLMVIEGTNHAILSATDNHWRHVDFEPQIVYPCEDDEDVL